jgi:DNA helicase-2/ATP-dependent DNA helicase PcrA
MVDEFQETSLPLPGCPFPAEKSRNLCVVGDDDQSIYSWRGRTIEHSQVRERFPGAEEIKLVRNFRSTGNNWRQRPS